MKAYTRVLNQLDEVAKAKGSKAKAVLLNLYLQDDHFQRVVQLILNPFVTMGINTFSWHRPADIVLNEASEDDFYDVLIDLKERRLTGQAARDALTDLTRRGVPGELLWRIINKDPKAGFQAGPVNKIIPGLIPEFSYMRCSRPSQVVKTPLNYAAGVIVDLKSDGMFINMDREVDSVLATTRQGNPLPMSSFPKLAEAAMALNIGTQTHGELVVYRHGVLLPRQVGNGLINSIIEGATLPLGDEVNYHVWDQIPRAAAVKKGRYNVPYKQRRAELARQLPDPLGLVSVIESRICYSKGESVAYFKEVLLRGLEGTVEKDPEMIWEDGTSKGQIKHKGEFECDLEIVGYTEGKGRLADTFGALMGKSKDGLLRVNVSGIPDDLRKKINADREGYLHTIMNVTYNGITEPSPSNQLYSLFLPRLNELRKGYTEAETLEKIKADYQDVIDAM